jgi:predicted TIM-barrel fold metal-dependent hydrolase
MNSFKGLTKITLYSFSLLFILLLGCEPGSYTLEDFNKVEKIDAHVHINSMQTIMLEQAAEDNFKLMTINVDYPDFVPVEDQFASSVHLLKSYPERIAFASTFYMVGWDDSSWQENTIKYLDNTIASGASAVKVWKNIGMSFKDKDSNLVMIDDPKFDPIFFYLKENNIPVVGHMGEPKDCWLPIEEMMVTDVGKYFKAHPQYHMYLHPEMPSYEEQMNARDRMLEKNKDMVFMGAHLASLEWSVEKIAEFLDKFSNAVVDMAARMDYIKVQTGTDREKVRQFFIEYQDRILYATDLVQDPGVDSEELKNTLHDYWLNDWKFLTTDSLMTSPDLNNSFHGLKLSKDIIDKIYCKNAKRVFPDAWNSKNE